MKTVIYSEVDLDYKYNRIFEGLDIEVIPVTTIRFLKTAFRKKETDKKYIYHIRYLRWRGFLQTLPMYCLIILVCKLRKIPILYTCHNLVEHRYPSKLYSICVRNLVLWAAGAVIVLHEDIAKKLSRFSRKIHTACFGDFRAFFQDKHQANDVFNREYQDWLKHRYITAPDIVFVGRYSRYKKVEYLVKFLEKHTQINGLIISGGCPIKTSAANICIFDQKVVAELDRIHQQKGIIGFVATSNFSVPTAVYVYANYNIPIMAANDGPASSLIRKYKMGEVFDSQGDIHNAFVRIKSNYESYQAGAELFNSQNNWAVSQKTHKLILDCL